MKTIREALAQGKRFLVSRGWSPEEAERECRFILAALLGIRPLDLYLAPDRPFPADLFWEKVNLRAQGLPLALVLGEVEFWGRSFKVRPGVLIPRPETEVLVEAFLEEGPKEGWILELGVGSGVVIITALLERPALKGLGVEISPQALKVAQENRKYYQLEPRLLLVQGDWLAPLHPGAGFKALLSNPPYVSEEDYPHLPPEVLNYEPQEALWAGKQGLLFLKRTLAEAGLYLAEGAKMFLEIGYDQRQAVEELCRQKGYQVHFYQDLSGFDRVAVVER